jgi:uncharacterized protein with NRDE domain
MCTVTYIPGKDGCFITSSRDEKSIRGRALFPQAYKIDDAMMVYPKDADNGGTWIAMAKNGNAAVLLNGAFTKHIPQPPYKKSRGLVFLEILSGNAPVMQFFHLKLRHIEPFTIIILEKNRLYECRWDDNRKHCKQLLKSKPYIWSSATLYSEETATKRRQWFDTWLAQNPAPLQEDIQQFHLFAGDGDKRNDICMNRDNQMFTVSVTSMELGTYKGTMLYNDLQTGGQYKYKLVYPHQYALHDKAPGKTTLLY